VNLEQIRVLQFLWRLLQLLSNVRVLFWTQIKYVCHNLVPFRFTICWIQDLFMLTLINSLIFDYRGFMMLVKPNRFFESNQQVFSILHPKHALPVLGWGCSKERARKALASKASRKHVSKRWSTIRGPTKSNMKVTRHLTHEAFRTQPALPASATFFCFGRKEGPPTKLDSPKLTG
jgi:hypothetical protein